MVDFIIIVYAFVGFTAFGVYLNGIDPDDIVGAFFTFLFYPILLIASKRFRLLFLDEVERSVRLGVKNIGELLRGE